MGYMDGNHNQVGVEKMILFKAERILRSLHNYTVPHDVRTIMSRRQKSG